MSEAPVLESLDLLFHLPAEIEAHGVPRVDWWADEQGTEFVYAFPRGEWSAFRSVDGQHTWQRLTRWPSWAGPQPTSSGSPPVAASNVAAAEPAGPGLTRSPSSPHPGPAGEALCDHTCDCYGTDSSGGVWDPHPKAAHGPGHCDECDPLAASFDAVEAARRDHTTAFYCHDETCSRPKPHTVDVCGDPELGLHAVAERVRATGATDTPTPEQVAHVQRAADAVIRNTLRKACADMGHHVHGQCDDTGAPICARCATPHYGATDGLEWRAPSDPGATTLASASRRRGGPRQTTRRARG